MTYKSFMLKKLQVDIHFQRQEIHGQIGISVTTKAVFFVGKTFSFRGHLFLKLSMKFSV